MKLEATRLINTTKQDIKQVYREISVLCTLAATPLERMTKELVQARTYLEGEGQDGAGGRGREMGACVACEYFSWVHLLLKL